MSFFYSIGIEFKRVSILLVRLFVWFGFAIFFVCFLCFVSLFLFCLIQFQALAEGAGHFVDGRLGRRLLDALRDSTRAPPVCN